MSYRLMVVAAEHAPLRDMASQLGDEVQVQLFTSPNDALWEVRANPPEALLAEMDLPGMSGLELAEILPNFELMTRVVLYSPTDDSARAEAESVGVFRFLHGVISTDQLRAAVHAAAQAATAAAAEVAAQPEPEPEPEPEPPRSARASLRPITRAAPPPAPPAPPPRSTSAASDERREFTPARVTLPSRAEREATANAAPAPAAAKGGLAARSKAAAARAPEPRPAAPAPSSAATDASGAGAWRSTSSNLIVTEKNINTIRSVMIQLSKDLGTQSVMLTDRAGMVLVEVGTAHNLPMMIVLPLLSTGFSTTGEVARQLREEDATSVYIHEGASVDLYCFDVMQRFLLVLVFNKQVVSSKIGAVWINAKRAIRELREAFGK
jgi:DNA-binding NarL/FixJ family response regulator